MNEVLGISLDKFHKISIVNFIMNGYITDNIIGVGKWEFFVYLALAFLAGWILKSVVRKNWLRDIFNTYYGDSRPYLGQYPQQGHTYIEYVPEMNQAYYPFVAQGSTETYHQTPAAPLNTTAAAPNNIPVRKELTTSNQASISENDLKLIEGIGPKIEQVLKDAGIMSWQDLAETPASRIRIMLEQAGPQYSMHDPTTWPHQAYMASSGRFDELYAYQDFLNGGRE